MIAFILCVILLTWSSGKCDPPGNSYLPPSNNGGNSPSSQYGPPERNGVSHSGDNRPTQLGFGGRPQRNYLPPASGQSGAAKQNTQYGAPTTENFGQGNPSSFNGRVDDPSTHGYPNSENSPSSRLTDIQSSFSGNTGHSSFNGDALNPSGSGLSKTPDISYGPSSSGIQSSNSQIRSDGYSPNKQTDDGYGRQNSRNQNGLKTSYAQTSSSFGPSGADRTDSERGHLREAENEEPAKYEFSYDVENPETGTKFGHSEQRDGDLAIGEYNVVLPDGRKQVVEYEAGLDGFKPQIRYEGSPQNDVQTQSGNNGYSGSSNVDGFPGTNHGQPKNPGQYQDVSAFIQTKTGQLQDGTGYPRDRNGQGNGYTSGGPNQGHVGYDYSEPNNGFEGLNERNQGSSGCLNGNSGSPQERGCFGPGRSGLGHSDSHDGSSSGEEGYPSGKPNGPIGTGY